MGSARGLTRVWRLYAAAGVAFSILLVDGICTVRLANSQEQAQRTRASCKAPQSREAKANPEQTGVICQPRPAVGQDQPGQQSHHEGDPASDLANIIMAAAAVASAIFAGLLVRLTRALIKVGRDQHEAAVNALAIGKISADAANLSAHVALEAGELAKSQFVATHRPRIAIKGLFVLNTADTANESALLFQIYNRGDSEAQIVDVKFYMNINGTKASIWPQLALFEPKLPITIQSGYDERARAIISSDWKKWLRDDYKAPSENPTKWEIWEIGLRVTVVYLDKMGRRRQTSVHRSYNVETHSFARVKDSEFEYED